MRINACIASREHPQWVKEIIAQTLAMAKLPDTKIVIALDDDDFSAISLADEIVSDKVIVSIAAREDSLGAKYNRAAAAYDADLYVLLADDVVIATPDWDIKLIEPAGLFPDGIFCVNFGYPVYASGTPAAFAASKKLVEMMGFFLNPYHPYWWHDAYLNEIAQFIGRRVEVNVQMSYPFNFEKTRGMRDVLHWATFFDVMRKRRMETARQIIDSPENLDSPERKTWLKQNMFSLAQQMLQSSALNREPAHVRHLENGQGYDAPNDERYQRIYQASQKLMAELACG